MKTYWVGDDTLMSNPLNPPTEATMMDPISEREEDDPTDNHSDDFSEVETEQLNEEDEELAPASTKNLDEFETSSQASHGTHTTHSTSLGNSTEEPQPNDHYSGVHCEDGMGSHQSPIQMDGTVTKAPPRSLNQEAMAQLSKLYAC